MLTPRQIIPPLTARTAGGRTVQAWDYKQKRALLIAFLHAECTECDAFLARLLRDAARLADLEATALVVLPATPLPQVSVGLPPHVVVAADVTGRSRRAFLGQDQFDSRAPSRGVGVFVTDRFGELYAQWYGGHDALPGLPDAFGWLHQIQLACDECGAPHWPVD
ncbi:MAG: hypothetical protein ACRD5F_11875 [Candidatus Acidiferrales bacterium]